ncbi:bifunctional NAD(P)H-hydrate repair enzyme Nnr [Clostridium saccharobutylicum]|uniref:NAD(P)H-hydrate dehydratase n=1 Tax=Clostridium saccharobutylicum TaxID=169679 RepID=UPI000983D67B|nr:NAD(P)H-hydrate dehydratase [Clostridium saccharobutylicum]AQS12057.1 bifunctional NAD(P)H-hydrate repair enzyme Nnr [Clostridium saccharobutylicum]MBC2435754.1 NAD(P)H-hydrate dehydratase [Clostridium saccharobutylicum]NSB87169.1 NAD(P)H-hydrate epimerase [Clostridium saccharobutylicum]NYC29923.1 NAD(P)H-hydrate epimerase [Clostridium saccharobutylicum]OOM18600.1 bifunctional NAD(P)H-hydrate repair enzyme Nnr [Clostridium saccharobutylicum]
MFEIFSSDKCKNMDKEAIEELGIPGIILMENAAIGIFDNIKDKGSSFLILCGKGNNGGDALALSRHLIIAGKNVKVYIISKDEEYSDDFKVNFNILKGLVKKEDIVFIRSEDDINDVMVNDLENYDITVDGIFGVGLNKELTGMFKKTIKYVNEYAKCIVAIDIPSGLDCNLGIERGISVRADYTYTFEVIKKGFLNYQAIGCVGDVRVLKIGIPEHIKQSNSDGFYILEKNEYKQLVPKRKVYGHKGSYGRAVIVAGRKGFTGAAFITTECTVRAGSGLTTLICNEDVQEELSNKLIESMTITWEDERLIELIKNANSIAFGPGIGTSDREASLLEKVVDNSSCPIVIDADGITLLARKKSLLKKLKGRAVITPHPGEMARFLDMGIEQIEENRSSIAKEVAKRYGITVLLKGYNTVISDGEDIYINPTGNSKMASGGMGDALTGIINAFISQGIGLKESALLGAYIHGYIADKLSEQVYIVNARDIINELPKQINNIISE